MPISVLVLDPEKVFQTSVARKLRLHDIRVLTRPGFEGLKPILESLRFDALLLDAALLRSGLDPLRAVLAAHPDMAVILTASPEDAAVVRQTGALVAECLVKPIHPDTLLASVERHAGEPECPDDPESSPEQVQALHKP
jgi:DNA-binding response OmpR family regulator